MALIWKMKSDGGVAYRDRPFPRWGRDMGGGCMKQPRSITVFLCLLVFGALYFCFRRPCIPIGGLRWIYLGENVSVIRACGKDLMGPGFIELHVSSNFVYGACSSEGELESRWFAIGKYTRKVYAGETVDEVERLLESECPPEEAIWPPVIRCHGSFYKTFQSQWEANGCKHGWTW